MATLIPALGSCSSRMESGERRLAERLEAKLDDDYLLWYNVPVGDLQSYPDFIVLHPSRGILILEVKDWKLGSTILGGDKDQWQILDKATGEPKSVTSPIEQAHHHALSVINRLGRDPQLQQKEGKYTGGLCLPWTYGAVFPNITRKALNESGFGNLMQASRVICQDEMTESVNAEDFQSRLWGMFPYGVRGSISLPQIDRIRWILFPEVRVPVLGQAQSNLFDAQEELPDLMRVMDVQQEQLARSLGDGHRVIHGVAGSGKTMILAYRAEYLAKISHKPILILCFSRPLADKLALLMQQKGLAEKVHVRSFHVWCTAQLRAFGQAIPAQDTTLDAMFEAQVDAVIRAVDRGQIPGGQYAAVLIDEGHDFLPHWPKLIVQMVDPETNSLLLLYDHAQAIFQKQKIVGFSFKQVGIAAQGRTTILKINYRNIRQILATAHLVARELLSPQAADEDGVPLIRPVGVGRDGDETMVIRLPSRLQEWQRVCAQLIAAHKEGFAWSDMAVICHYKDRCEDAQTQLERKNIPCELLGGKSGLDRVRVLTMHSSKGLEFPVVALPNMELMPSSSIRERDEAQLFYVAATRATHKLIITSSGDSKFMQYLSPQSINTTGEPA